MRISMMMAMDNNQLIGRGGTMPWHISAELQYFKRITMGKPIIMGRNTYNSIGKPLPGRHSIVVTRNTSLADEGLQVAASLEQAFQLASEYSSDEMMVVGGATLCEAAMPYTEQLYLTVIDHEFENGDTWLKSYKSDEWEEVSSESNDETDQGGYRFVYYVMKRRSPALPYASG